MRYTIASGTPVEIDDGETIHSVVIDGDLHFAQTDGQTSEEWVFRVGRERIYVPKALVTTSESDDAANVPGRKRG